MSKVRFGIIGLGNMGSSHVSNWVNGYVKNADITAVCDTDPKRFVKIKEQLGEDIGYFLDSSEMIKSGTVDAILICTPHYDHPTIAIEAFAHGLHVISEKPAGVYTKAVREMNEAAVKSGKSFGIMFQQRMNPVYQTVKKMIESGEIGKFRRVNWIITDWYRSQNYYNSGGWRATWAGEGGGVLLNQDPHQLDLIQWLCGVPTTVYANCSYGKYHDIEVEDDVNAIFEYENGATGAFITTTGDAPGTNRLEITGDRGKIIVERGEITFYRTTVSVDEHLFNSPDGFSQPEVWKCEVPVKGVDTQHYGLLNNFIDNILNGTPLIAPGSEGIKGLSISNAIHLSSWTGQKVSIPLDEDLFYNLLQEKIKTSTYVKPVVDDKVASLLGSYGASENPRKK